MQKGGNIVPLFHYQIIDPKGKKKVSVIEAPTIEKAKEYLRQQKIFVTKLSTQKQKSFFSSLSREISPQRLRLFTTKLAELLKAGLPLYQSLHSLAEQATNQKEHPIIQSLIEQIKEGNSLSEAMKLYPKNFPPLYRAMVGAGERVGKLGSSLEKLAVLLTKKERLKKKITTSLLYPFVLALFSSVVICIMLLFVIPSLENLFDKENVNGFTSCVMTISQLFRNQWHILCTICALMTGGVIYFLKQPLGRKKIEEFVLWLPFIKGMIVKVAVARFTRTLASLLEGGVPMIDALKIAKEVIGYSILEAEIVKTEQKIIEGNLLSQELKNIWWMPSLVSQMVAIGEEGGTLFHMLDHLAQMYEEEVERTLTRVAELSQPFILLIMGGIVGLIMLAVLIPLTDATHLV